MAEAQHSKKVRGRVLVDCVECDRGCNGTSADKCCAGFKHKTPKFGCYLGTLLPGLEITD